MVRSWWHLARRTMGVAPVAVLEAEQVSAPSARVGISSTLGGRAVTAVKHGASPSQAPPPPM
ncbi:MAG: hypothetical protein PVG07_16275 [Acidobacteriota bacterium]